MAFILYKLLQDKCTSFGWEGLTFSGTSSTRIARTLLKKVMRFLTSIDLCHFRFDNCNEHIKRYYKNIGVVVLTVPKGNNRSSIYPIIDAFYQLQRKLGCQKTDWNPSVSQEGMHGRILNKCFKKKLKPHQSNWFFCESLSCIAIAYFIYSINSGPSVESW